MSKSKFLLSLDDDLLETLKQQSESESKKRKQRISVTSLIIDLIVEKYDKQK